MSIELCPDCELELIWQRGYHCKRCENDFDKIGYCPDCEVQLEKLQACGASSHFCNPCNELKSKTRVKFLLVKQI
ncbi:zinc ribbon domain-containing protein [Vibrio hepatarius]|uniref:zinc ribbon domain-containing protein n=1 Tax=Vibrio hepatarius TaxID=171383 RepID=UPI001C0922DB|nr:zinc ribbon domain-containing protein [Vibrio hepatarius]MBU2898366.1 zinc ribbon domain-containing protein [Vibrio hepatarius]